MAATRATTLARHQTVMLFRTAVLSERFDALHQELHATYTASIAA